MFHRTLAVINIYIPSFTLKSAISKKPKNTHLFFESKSFLKKIKKLIKGKVCNIFRSLNTVVFRWKGGIHIYESKGTFATIRCIPNTQKCFS